MENVAEIVWFVVAVALVLLELVLPGVILVFFGLGAGVTSLVVWLGLVDSLDAQLLVFSGASLALLFSLRRWVRARFTGYVPDAAAPARRRRPQGAPPGFLRATWCAQTIAAKAAGASRQETTRASDRSWVSPPP